MAGTELDPQARDLAASVVKGVVTPEGAAAAAGVTVETVNQWVNAYIADAKAGFEARAKSLLSQTKAGLLPQSSRTRAKVAPTPEPATPGTVATPIIPSSRGPLPPPTPFMTQSPSGTGVVPPLPAPPTPPASQSGDMWLRPLPAAPVSYPLPKPMPVGRSYSGSIQGEVLLDVARSLATLQQSGILTVRTPSDVGNIYFDAGEIVEAQYRGLGGQDALWRIFDAPSGNFEVEGYSPPKNRMVDAVTSALLAEAARRRSIAMSLRKHLGSPKQVFALAELSRDQLLAAGKLDPQLLALFDGKRTLEQVIAESPMDEFATLSQVQRLHDRGYLVPASLRPVELPATRSAAASRDSDSPSGIPSELPFKKRRVGRWVAGGAVAVGGMLAGTVIFAQSSLASIAEAPLFSRLTAWAGGSAPTEQGSPGVSAAAAVLPTGEGGACNAVAIADVAPETPSCPEGMAFVAPGRFLMGTDERTPALAAAQPAHEVRLTDGFCIDRTEVTVAAYEQCVSGKSCTEAVAQASWPRTEGPAKAWESSLMLHGKQCNAAASDRWNHPINCVTWTQASTYCQSLGRRLPTEAEWEYAARGSQGRAFPWGDASPKAALLNACGTECSDWHTSVGLASEILGPLYSEADGFAGTSPAGAFGLGSTPEGVFDLAGNVSEWTVNAPHDYATLMTLPAGARPTLGESHMIRGGAYNSSALEFVDPTFRFAMPNDVLSPAIGFRCVASP